MCLSHLERVWPITGLKDSVSSSCQFLSCLCWLSSSSTLCACQGPILRSPTGLAKGLGNSLGGCTYEYRKSHLLQVLGGVGWSWSSEVKATRANWGNVCVHTFWTVSHWVSLISLLLHPPCIFLRMNAGVVGILYPASTSTCFASWSCFHSWSPFGRVGSACPWRPSGRDGRAGVERGARMRWDGGLLE